MLPPEPTENEIDMRPSFPAAAMETAEPPSETREIEEGDLEAANVAIDLARRQLENACKMLDAAGAALETGQDMWPGPLALSIVRRHFRTNASKRGTAETENIAEIRSLLQNIRLALMNARSIFRFVDDRTASENTRGFYDSDFDVAAYAYSHNHIALTNKFFTLGPNCRAAVVVHQLAHFVEPRMRDIAGVRGPAYDALDFESARFNVHCYPNFVANAFPPYQDERFGMTRPQI